jgi:hypothetical protein
MRLSVRPGGFCVSAHSLGRGPLVPGRCARRVSVHLKGVIPFKKYGTRKRIEEAAKSSEPEVACRGPGASAFFYAFRAERRELVLNSFTTCRVASETMQAFKLSDRFAYALESVQVPLSGQRVLLLQRRSLRPAAASQSRLPTERRATTPRAFAASADLCRMGLTFPTPRPPEEHSACRTLSALRRCRWK